MATIEEMANVLYDVGATPIPKGRVKDNFRHLLRNAEDNGKYYIDGYGEHNIPCTYWVIGDYIVTYLTNNWEFHADMLTDEMMDDLIIEAI